MPNVTKTGPDRPVQPVQPGTGGFTGPDNTINSAGMKIDQNLNKPSLVEPDEYKKIEFFII